MLITTNITSSWFRGISFISQYPPEPDKPGSALKPKEVSNLTKQTLFPIGADYKNRATIIAGDIRYFWTYSGFRQSS
jgi:hypothetical protein